MVSRTQAKYLYNPENGRIMINTPLKRRVRPGLIPTNYADARDVLDDPRVLMARDTETAEEAFEQEQKQIETKNLTGSIDDIIHQVEDSMDKGELRQIGADVGLKGLTKAMKLETIRREVLDRLQQIKESTA